MQKLERTLGRARITVGETKIGIDDVGFIPLFWPKVYWASKDNITYTANRGEDFMATLAGQAQ